MRKRNLYSPEFFAMAAKRRHFCLYIDKNRKFPALKELAFGIPLAFLWHSFGFPSTFLHWGFVNDPGAFFDSS